MSYRKFANVFDVEQLRNLTNKDIAMSLMVIPYDELQLNIFRGDHWQDLLFLDAGSQKPFASSLVPIVKWFEGLPKKPYRELTEDEGRNNCLTPKNIKLKIRTPDRTNRSHRRTLRITLRTSPAPLCLQRPWLRPRMLS